MAALGHRRESAHAELANLFEVRRFNRQLRRASGGDLCGPVGEAVWRQLVRRRVREVARAVRPSSDDAGAPRCLSDLGVT